MRFYISDALIIFIDQPDKSILNRLDNVVRIHRIVIEKVDQR